MKTFCENCGGLFKNNSTKRRHIKRQHTEKLELPDNLISLRNFPGKPIPKPWIPQPIVPKKPANFVPDPIPEHKHTQPNPLPTNTKTTLKTGK